MTGRAAGLATLVVLAALLRIAAIAYTHATAAPAEENRIIARNLAAGRGFTFTQFGVTGPTAIRGPAYPMLLEVLGPDHVGLILAVNVIAGAATVVAAFRLTKRLLSPLPVLRGRAREGVFASGNPTDAAADPHPNPPPAYRGREPEAIASTRAAWTAAVLFAVWPTQVYAATLTQGLSLAVLLTLASLALALGRTPLAIIAAGVLAALAALTEPILALPLALAALVLGGRRHWRDAALYLGVAALLVSPWLYRNAIVFGRPMPITSNFWPDAFVGNSPDATGFTFGPTPVDVVRGSQARLLASRFQRLSSADFDRLKVAEPAQVAVMKGWTIRWIEAHPTKYLNLCLSRAVETLGQSGLSNSDRPAVEFWPFALSRAAAALVAIWVWVAAYFRRRWSRPMSLTLLVAIGLVIVPALSQSAPRNGVLMDVPELLAAAIACGVGLWSPLPVPRERVRVRAERKTEHPDARPSPQSRVPAALAGIPGEGARDGGAA